MNEYFSFTSLCLNMSKSLYMNLFITSMSLVWTCGSSTQEIILPRLKYIGEFLLTSPKQSEMNILCSLSGARLMNDVSRMIPSKLSSMHKTVVMVSFVYGLVFHNLYSSKVWTIGL